MDCFILNEDIYKNIENFLDNQKVEEKFPEETYFKSHYSSATLINDWSEKRYSTQNQQFSSTEPPLSEHMDQFRKPCVTQVPDRKEYFNRIFENYGYGQELLLDHLGFSYYGNYVSTYDLCYNHLVKGICGPFPRHYCKGVYKPETDLSQIYGNLTQWGLKESVYEKYKKIDCIETPISETSSEYVQHNLSEVKKVNDFSSFKKVKITYG